MFNCFSCIVKFFKNIFHSKSAKKNDAYLDNLLTDPLAQFEAEKEHSLPNKLKEVVDLITTIEVNSYQDEKTIMYLLDVSQDPNTPQEITARINNFLYPDL